MKRFILLLCCVSLAFTSFSQDTYWTIDPVHTTIGFNATHLVISEVSGKFQEFSGNVSSINDQNFSNANVALTIFSKSIDTDNAERDKHLKSADFFNVNKHPHIKFVSTKVKRLQGPEYKVIGKLTINGITKEVAFDLKHGGTIKDPSDGITKAGFKLSGTVSRYDFGLKWNIAEAAESFAVGEEIEIVCNVRLNMVTEKAEEVSN